MPGIRSASAFGSRPPVSPMYWTRVGSGRSRASALTSVVLPAPSGPSTATEMPRLSRSSPQLDEAPRRAQQAGRRTIAAAAAGGPPAASGPAQSPAAAAATARSGSTRGGARAPRASAGPPDHSAASRSTDGAVPRGELALVDERAQQQDPEQPVVGRPADRSLDHRVGEHVVGRDHARRRSAARPARAARANRPASRVVEGRVEVRARRPARAMKPRRSSSGVDRAPGGGLDEQVDVALLGLSERPRAQQ